MSRIFSQSFNRFDFLNLLLAHRKNMLYAINSRNVVLNIILVKYLEYIRNREHRILCYNAVSIG